MTNVSAFCFYNSNSQNGAVTVWPVLNFRYRCLLSNWWSHTICPRHLHQSNLWWRCSDPDSWVWRPGVLWRWQVNMCALGFSQIHLKIRLTGSQRSLRGEGVVGRPRWALILSRNRSWVVLSLGCITYTVTSASAAAPENFLSVCLPPSDARFTSPAPWLAQLSLTFTTMWAFSMIAVHMTCCQVAPSQASPFGPTSRNGVEKT